MKWAEVGVETTIRAQHLAKFLNAHGCANELELVPAPTENLETFLRDMKPKFDQIRFSSAFGTRVMGVLTGKPFQERVMNACDALFKEDGDWWPRSFLFEALGQIFVESAVQIDLETSALIIGTGSAARVSTAALFHAGFRKFLITGMQTKDLEGFVTNMSRHLLGVQIEITPPEKLVLLAGKNSVVVNATPVRDDNSILTELLYFNFIRQDGLVWDFSLTPLNHPFVDEALALGLNVYRGINMASRVDQLWALKIFGKTFDRQVYEESLLKELTASEAPAVPG